MIAEGACTLVDANGGTINFKNINMLTVGGTIYSRDIINNDGLGKILYKSDQGSVYLFDNASSGGVFRYSESYARADDPRAPTNIVGSSGNDSVYIYDRVHRWNSTNREYEYAYSSIEDSVAGREW